MIKIPRGTQDILPEDSKKWRYIENQLDELMTFYNYKEIRTPILKVQIFLQEVLVIQPMSYKKKCIHLKIKAIEVLH